MGSTEKELNSIHEKLVIDILSASKYYAFESWPDAKDGSFARRSILEVPSILQAKVLADFLRDGNLEVNVHRFSNSSQLRFTTPRDFENFVLSNSLPLYLSGKDAEKIKKHDAEELVLKEKAPSYETCGYTQAAIERLTNILACSEQVLVDA